MVMLGSLASAISAFTPSTHQMKFAADSRNLLSIAKLLHHIEEANLPREHTDNVPQRINSRNQEMKENRNKSNHIRRRNDWSFDYCLGGGRFGKRMYGDYGIGGGRFG